MELTLVYQVGGCGKTYNNNKRRDTPHLNSMRYSQNALSHNYTRKSVVRSPVVIENFHISYFGQYENTFVKMFYYAPMRYNSITNLQKKIHMNNTIRVSRQKYDKFILTIVEMGII